MNPHPFRVRPSAQVKNGATLIDIECRTGGNHPIQLLYGRSESYFETFQLRRYLFDSRLLSTRDFGELKFDGRASGIYSALNELAERYRGQPLAGILLFTDGNATDIAPPQQPNLPPVYPVLIGRPGALRDLSIASVSASKKPLSVLGAK